VILFIGAGAGAGAGAGITLYFNMWLLWSDRYKMVLIN
jgi:hypothetical protein